MDLKPEENNFINDFYRYLSFWPYYLITIISCLIICFIFLRYTDPLYSTVAKVEIIDKAQDSEMALPKSMTIFNGAMINLENEVSVLSSFRIHKIAVSELNANIKFYSKGRFNSVEKSKNDWIKDYEINFKTDLDSFTKRNSYHITLNKSQIIINHFDHNGELVSENNFNNLSTKSKNHLLPFDLDVYDFQEDQNELSLIIQPFDLTVNSFRENVIIEPIGKDSDQLSLSIEYPNPKVAEQYLNKLIDVFDRDGIQDRRLEYKRTIEFVDSRSVFLRSELESIEDSKQNFKENNSFTNIESDASLNVEQKINYNSELFELTTQKELVAILEDEILKNNYKLMPYNIGINDNDLNELISKHNDLVSQRNKFLLSAGSNNPFIKNIEILISNSAENIAFSISNYKKNLQISIENIRNKESEFETFYSSIPKKEKILRSIERELEIKEALFLLLLQKKEEASINFAVTKPSIKIIDSSISSIYPVYPKKIEFFAYSLILGISIPSFIIFLIFTLDNKVHTRDQLQNLIEPDSLPIIGEIPHLKKELMNQNAVFGVRNPLFESIRIMLANLNFSLTKEKKVMLITSSIKGEGKTLISIFTAKSLVLNKKKVILVGADLRNPQIHTNFKLDKSKLKGLSNYLTLDSSDNIDEYVYNIDGLDILFSGPIPPTPSLLLSSAKFKNLIEKLKSEYDYVIIDSAPCLLVSDTFEISNIADLTIYSFRANHTDRAIVDFIKESARNNKLKNINLVLNGVGNSRSYGYGYGYGYKYGYKYTYNYGYGYGYSNE